MEKKLLYITSRVFWPTKSGHEVHIYNYCRALNEKYRYCVDVYILDKKSEIDKAAQDKPNFIRNIIAGKNISKLNIFTNLITKTVFNREHWALQSSLYYNKENEYFVKNLDEKEHYDVLFVDMVRLASYKRAFSRNDIHTVLDMGDILSKRYYRQISNVSESSNVGGAYTNRMSKSFQSVLSLKWIQKAILRIENRLMKKSEIYWSEEYDSIILVSTVETDELNKKLSKPKAVTVRVGVNCDYFKELRETEKENKYISFVGDMRTAANSDTVDLIVSRILPLCKNVDKVVFVGKCSEQSIDKYRGNEKVFFTGMVPDIRDEVKHTAVFIAPMAYGTGVKIKIVEAMAMGMPVVTNSIGAEGIPGINGQHWFVGDTDKDIAAYIDELLTNSDKRTEMGRNAQELIESSFSWDATTKAFKNAGL